MIFYYLLLFSSLLPQEKLCFNSYTSKKDCNFFTLLNILNYK